jgi:hypothetical protein
VVLLKCYFHNINIYVVPVFTGHYTCTASIPVAMWYMAWVCGRSLAGIVGLNLVCAWMFVSRALCAFSGRSLCVSLITCTEKSY